MRRGLLALALLLLGGGCAALPARVAPPGEQEVRFVADRVARDVDGWRTLRARVEGKAACGPFAGELYVDRAQGALRLVARPVSAETGLEGTALFDCSVRDGRMRVVAPSAGGKLAERALAVPCPAPVPSGIYHGSGPVIADADRPHPLELIARALLPAPRQVSRAAWRVGGGGWLVTETWGATRTASHAVEEPALQVVCTTWYDAEGEWAGAMQLSRHVVLHERALAPQAFEVETRRSSSLLREPFSLTLVDPVYDEPVDPRRLEGAPPAPGAVAATTIDELGLGIE